jgi:hypothetical protein
MITFILVLIAIILLPFALWSLFRVLFSWQFWVLVGLLWLLGNHANDQMKKEQARVQAAATPTPTPTQYGESVDDMFKRHIQSLRAEGLDDAAIIQRLKGDGLNDDTIRWGMSMAESK